MSRRWPWYASAAVAVAVVLVLVATVWALRGDDSSSAVPAAPATADATQTPTPLQATPSTTPFPQPILSVPPLVPFPENVVMIVAHGGYAHGSGGYFSLTRHYRDPKGEIRTDELLRRSESGPMDIPGIVANERGELFATTCFGEFCGYSSGTESSETVVIRSSDGGMTWKEIGRVKGKWWARLALDNGVVAVNFEGQTSAYMEFPGAEVVTPPESAIPVGLDPIGFRGQLAWIVGTQILNRNGERLYEFELPGYPNLTVQSVLALRRGGPSPTMDSFPVVAASWTADGLPGQQQFFIGTFLPPIGLPLKVLKIENGTPRLAGWLNERDLIVTADYLRPSTCASDRVSAGADPAIIPYDLGSLSFIGTPFYSADCSLGSQRVVSTQFIAIWARARVNGDGDCVNLRREPSITAQVLDCLGDGAIVNTGKARSNDGTRFWQSVVGPSGQQGWIAAEFLED